jgi:hypothetical protein
VNDYKDAEKHLKKVFKEKFELIRGSEYFRGDIIEMTIVFITELSAHIAEEDSEDSLGSLDSSFDSAESSEELKDLEIEPEKKPNKKLKKFNRNPTFKCGKCNREFTKKWNYQRHLDRKTPCEPIVEVNDLNNSCTCAYCGRKYKSKANMQSHVMNYCKAFKNPQIKKQHLKQKEHANRLELENLRKEIEELKEN